MRAYQQMFLGPEGTPNEAANIVLSDLRKFCRATTTTITVSPRSVTIDPLATISAEGRREVWLHIMELLHLDEATVYHLRTMEQRANREGIIDDNG